MDYGLILDLETTGLDHQKDEIIEIGLLEFAMDENQLPSITEMYSGLEDPHCSLSPEIVKITGLTNDLLADRKIDWARVKAMVENSSIVIAHNADFDAGFIKQREELAGVDIHWGCSRKHVDWQAYGYGTRALNYLAADHGFVNPFAHRALFDCATTFRLVAPYISELIERSYEREYRIYAVGSPFESKDKLKARRYRWDAEKRCWHKSIVESAIEKEREFLREEIYPGAPTHEEVLLQPIGC